MSESSSFAAGCEIEAVASANGERGLRHGLHAAGQDQVRLAQAGSSEPH